MLIPIITPIVLLILFWGYWSQLFSGKKSVIISGDDFSRKRRVRGNGGKRTDLCKHPAGCAQWLPAVGFSCSFINKVRMYLRLRYVTEKLLEPGQAERSISAELED